MSEDVKYFRHATGVYDVFARTDGRLLGHVVEGGRRWYCEGRREGFNTRREAALALLRSPQK